MNYLKSFFCLTLGEKESFLAARLGSLSLGATQDLKRPAVKGGDAGSAAKLFEQTERERQRKAIGDLQIAALKCSM